MAEAVPAAGGEAVRRLVPPWTPLIALFLGLTALSTLLLFVLAEQTHRLFAWTVRPPVAAAFLGAGYAAGFVLVALIAADRVWARSRLGLVTVWVFVVLTLVATLAHLDRFHFGAEGTVARSAAWLWLAVYVVVPLAMAALLARQRRAPGADPPVSMPLGRAVVAVLATQAAVLLVVGAALMVAPQRVAASWPWPLTPLTGRATGAWWLALGAAAAGAIAERDLGRLRAPAVTYAAFGVLQLVALARFAGDVRWDHPSTWAYVALLVTMTTVGSYGWIARRRASARDAVASPGRVVAG